MRLAIDDLPLGDSRFRRVFAAEAISLLGTFVAPVALVFAVLSISDAAGVGLVLAAREVPLVVLLLGGGVIADRRSPRSLMIVADTVRAASQGATAALLIAGVADVWHLVLLQAINGGAQAFALPAQMGLIADIVEPRRRQAASALLLATVTVEHRMVAASQRLLADLREGWRTFRGSAWLWRGVALMSAWNAVYAVYTVLGPVVAGKAAIWAAVSTATGIGAVLGGMVLVRVRPRRPGVLLSAGLFCSCGPALALAAGLPTAVAIAAAVVCGAGMIGFNATWESTVQREMPRETLSRVMAYDMFGSFALAPIGFVAGGLLAEPLGATTTLFAAGILLGLLAALLWAVPGIRALRADV